MSTLLDANVLVALVVDDHVHHGPAERWLAELASGFSTCPITEGALVRFLLREGVATATAHGVIAALSADRRHQFWVDDVAFLEVPLVGVLGHRQVTDAYLAQLARHHAGRLATFDQGLAALHPDVTDLIAPR